MYTARYYREIREISQESVLYANVAITDPYLSLSKADNQSCIIYFDTSFQLTALAY